jgi:hypothetical protein
MIAGAVVFQAARWAIEPPSSPTTDVRYPDPVPTQRSPSSSRFPRVTLAGPDGAITMPTGSSRIIVNVWLQGCQDCMPAFEAMRSIKEHGGLGIRARVINVAYGEADPAWAARYGVRDNLVFDTSGASVVKPLGISTFTTFVVDRDGVIVHKDRPDQVGYADRLRGLADGVDSPSSIRPGRLTSEEVQQVARAHQTSIRDVCWERTADTKGPKATVKVTASIVVGANGDVVDASSTGTDAIVASCVEGQLRTWKFPAHGERSGTVQIPFVFARE